MLHDRDREREGRGKLRKNARQRLDSTRGGRDDEEAKADV